MALEFYVKEYFEKGLYQDFYDALKEEVYNEDVDPLNDIVDYYLWLYRVCTIQETAKEIEETTQGYTKTPTEGEKEKDIDEENIDTESEEFEKLKESFQYLVKAISLVSRKGDRYNKLRIYDEAFRYFQQIDNLVKAEKYLKKLIEIDTKSSITIENQAFFEYIKGNYQEAGNFYEILAKKNEHKYAKKLFLCLVKANFHNVALVEGYINRQEELIKDFKDQDNRRIMNPELFELHSEVYRITFQYAQALVKIQTAIEKSPKRKLKYTIEKIRILYYLKDYKRCIEEGRKLLEEQIKCQKSEHEIAAVFFYLAVAYGFNSEEGKTYLQKYEQYFKRRNTEYYYEMGKYYLLGGDNKNAKRCFEKSLQIDPSNIYSTFQLVAVLENEDKIDRVKIENILKKNKTHLSKYKEGVRAAETKNNFKVSIDFENLYNGIDSNIEHEFLKCFNIIETNPETGEIDESQFERCEKDNWGNAIIMELGEGGFASVKKIYNYGDQEIYAAKYVKLGSDKKAYEEFKKEVSIMTTLKHENLIEIKGYQRGVIYMEIAEGKDVASLLKEYVDLPEKFKVHILLGVARGVKELHEKKLVHGDIKCKNILLDKLYTGKTPYPTPKLCDFGLTGQKGKEFIETKGTLGYLPSEFFKSNKFEFSTDIFAIGMTLYELLTGNAPFYNLTKKDKQREQEAHNLPDLSQIKTNPNLKPENREKYIELIKQCTEKNVNTRITIFPLKEEIENIYKTFK